MGGGEYMRQLWSVTFFLNLVPQSWIYFFLRRDIILQFKMAEESRFFLSGHKYVEKVLIITVGVNFILYVMYRLSRRTNIFNWLYFPNRGYWLSTPDMRLDTLVKLQDTTTMLAICTNCIIAFTQFYLFMINFYPKILKASTLQLYWAVVLVVGFSMIALALIEFNLPPEAKKQAT